MPSFFLPLIRHTFAYREAKIWQEHKSSERVLVENSAAWCTVQSGFPINRANLQELETLTLKEQHLWHVRLLHQNHPGEGTHQVLSHNSTPFSSLCLKQNLYRVGRKRRGREKRSGEERRLGDLSNLFLMSGKFSRTLELSLWVLKIGDWNSHIPVI